MKKTELHSQKIRAILARIIGDTTASMYFSYIGIFKHNAMIALYKNDCLYLYISPQDFDEIKAYPEIVKLQEKRINSAFHYYFIPDTLFDHPIFEQLVKHSVEAVVANKTLSYYEQTDKLRHLPHFTFQAECMFRRIHIYTVSELVKCGVIPAFVALVKNNERVNHITLFKIYGAIHKQLIYTIPEKVKFELLEQANEALIEAGLKPITDVKW